MEDWILLAVAMLATGCVAGVLAGLFGIGIVIVPVLEAVLGLLGVDPAIRMHVAVATSLATIIPTSISSARAHHRRGAVDVEVVKRWAVFVLVGALLGAWIAAQVHSRVLAGVFATLALLVAAKMVFLMTLTLFNEPIHRAVGTAALFGLVISLPGTIGFILTGLDDPRLPPGSLGYVNLLGLAAIAPTTVLMAPLGARIAHAFSAKKLSILFGLFLVIVSLRLFYRALLPA